MDEELPQDPKPLAQCNECTIFIGPGYQETRPFPSPEGRGVLCWRCYESYWRRMGRRTGTGPSERLR